MIHRLTAVATAAGVIAGFGAGYFFAKKQLSSQFEEALATEIEATRAFYKATAKHNYPTPGDAVDALVPPHVVETLLEYKGEKTPTAYHNVHKDAKVGDNFVEGAPLVTRDVFEHSSEGPDEPILVISQAEFEENANEYQGCQFTFYEGDNILTDDREDKIEDIEAAIGNQFRSRFGDISGDENTVHVLNNHLQLLFEIVRSRGFYCVDVLGEDPPLETPGERVRRGG